MYLWRRSASRKWFGKLESRLRALAGDQLAIIERPNQKRLQLEVAAKSRAELRKLAHEFGGGIDKLPRDWLKRALRRKTRPLRIGNKKLIIPAGAAFGTGEHATTAMCLRMLERMMRVGGAQAAGLHARRVRPPDTVVDLGTGSGILALAARVLGATRVTAIDNDPIAIATAKQNARLNKIRGVQFRVGDVLRARFPREVDIVTANLFSELLIELMPKLKAARCLILSGILREQAGGVMRALKRHKIDVVQTRRRGKWTAIVAESLRRS
jgi:ribosomal protein L11 methyltransferase